MTGDSSVLMEAYQNLPGFGDSLGASGFFDVAADDLWDTDGEDDKGKWMPPQKKYNAEVKEEEGEKASSKKAVNTRPSLNRKAKNLRSVSHKVNEVLSQMDESNKAESPQEPQDEQQEPTQEQAPTETPTSGKSQLKKKSRSNSMTNPVETSEQSPKRDSKTRRDSGSKKKEAADAAVPSKTALAELCEGKMKSEVIEPETPKTRKARLSKKPKALSMRDLTATSIPESTSNTKKSKRTSQKKLITDSMSASEGGEKLRRRSSQKQSSSRELIATASKKPRSLSMRDLTSLSVEDDTPLSAGIDIPESAGSSKKPKAKVASRKKDSMSVSEGGERLRRRSSSKKLITDSMSASQGGEKQRRKSSRKKLITDSISASEGGEKLRRRSSQKQSSPRELIATTSTDKARVKASTDKTDKTASTKRSSSSKKASMSASEGGVSSRRRKQDSEQKPTSIGSSSRTSSSKLSSSRKSSKKCMSVSEGAGGATRRSSRLTSDASGTRATRDPVTPRSRRKNAISKKLDDMPGLQSIEEASTSAAAETTTVVEELTKGRSPKKAESMRKLLVGDVATNAARGGKVVDPKSTKKKEISSSSESRRIQKINLPKSMSLQDFSAVAGEPEAKTNKQRTKKRVDSFRNLSLGDALEASRQKSKKTSAQSVTEGMSRQQDVSSRSTRSNPGGRLVRRNSFGSAIGPANDLGVSSVQDTTPETPRTRKTRLAKAKVSLSTLQNFLGTTAPLSEEDGKQASADDPFSSIDADDKSITTEIARVANGRRRRRNSVAGGQTSIAQTLQHLDKKYEAPIMAPSGPTQRAQNELFATEGKKAAWVHRRLRALGVEEETA